MTVSLPDISPKFQWIDDWVSACRKVVVAGVRFRGRNRKMRGECVDDDMKVFGLRPEWAVFRDM